MKNEKLYRSIILISVPVFIFFSEYRIFSQFEPDFRLTNNSFSSELCGNNGWSVASFNNNVYAVWADDRTGNYEIYFKRSSDDGNNWLADLRITNDTSLSVDPCIAVSGSNLHVVWVDTRWNNTRSVHYRNSTNGGVSWVSSSLRLANTFSSNDPSISASGSNVYVVWQSLRNGTKELTYMISTNNGTNWLPFVHITNNESTVPSIASSGNNVFIVWREFIITTSDYETVYKRSTDAGNSWSPITILSSLTDDTQCNDPTVNIVDSSVHIAWIQESGGNKEIYYRSTTNLGITWRNATNLSSNSTTLAENVSIAGSTNALHIVWCDPRDGNNEIYYKRSQDGGLTWEDDKRLTNNSGSSTKPSISFSGTILHVIWQDDRDGNNEIYYKRDLNGNVLPVELEYFDFFTKGNSAELMWRTSWELNNRGFDIERASITDNTWRKIGFINGKGTSNVSNGYMYKDENLKAADYTYRLRQIDYNGNYEYYNLNKIVTIATPGKFDMGQNYPNPSNPKCKINFEMPVYGRVNIKIYDIAGREVITLLDETREADYYTVEFDGSNIASGVYFYRIIASGEGQNYTKTMKMVIVK